MMNMDNRQSQQQSSGIQERRFVCPLTKNIMSDAVRINRSGKSYERRALYQWIKRNGSVCPVTGMTFRPSDVETNFALQWEILYWQRQSDAGDDDQATVTSVSSTSMSCHQSLPPPPPLPVDSPPTRPKRRGSGTAASAIVKEQPPQPLDNSRRFTSCKEVCPSDTLLRLPQRCPSFLNLMNLDCIEPAETTLSPDGDDTMDHGDGMDRILSALDAAIDITEGM